MHWTLEHLLALSFVALAPLSAQRLIGCDSTRALFRIDPVSGARTAIGTISANAGTSAGLALDASTGRVFLSSSSTDSLYTLDLATGAATLVGPFGGSQFVMHGIEYDAAHGVLYGMSTHDTGLYRIDTTTGTAVLVGTTGITGIWNLGYDRNHDVLYAVNTDDRFYRLDRATGAATLVGPLNGPINANGLAFDPDTGRFWLVDNSLDALYSVDPVTGAASLVGPMGASNMLGLLYEDVRLLHDQGPIVTHPGGGAGGADASHLESGMTTFGFGVSLAAQTSLADEFVLGAPAVVTHVELFAYQASTSTVSTVNHVGVELYAANPSLGGAPVVGSPTLATNLLVAESENEFFCYRVTAGQPLSINRPVMRVKVALPTPLSLVPGVYHLRYQLGGALTSGPFTPPITVLGQTVTGNAQQCNSLGVWSPALDGGRPQGLPFRVFGYGQEGARVLDTGLPACGPTTLVTTGVPTPGGFVVTRLNGVTVVPFLGYGFLQLPLQFCGCTLGHDWAVASFGSESRVDIPASVSFVGMQLRVQGADFQGAGGCANPMIGFSNTLQFDVR